MKKETRILPYLKRDELVERDELESRLAWDLGQCAQVYGIDRERAEHLMNDAVISIFDVEYRAYAKRAGYAPTWIEEIMSETVFRVMQHAQNIHWGDDLNPLFGSLVKTLMHHLRHDSILKGADEFRSAFPEATLQLPEPITEAVRTSRSITSPSAARKLEQFVSSNGMTYTDFAAKVQADERTIRRFRKRGTIDKTVIARIADALGTSVGKLLE
jgi:plasmid maintenance system antidote protein VapI